MGNMITFRKLLPVSLLCLVVLCVSCGIVLPSATHAQSTGTTASTGAAATTQPSSTVQPGTPPVNCNSWTGFFTNPVTCIGWSLSGVISELLVYLASWVLAVAGILFNWVLNETVLQFGQFVNNNIITGINTAWTAFRDISNIVIIGMFTFIAIMTILGSTDYGYKKMLSRVLIVAVLINFSLLFTKIIIDVSNFAATQIYTAASANDPDLTVNNSNPTNTSVSQLVSSGNQQAGVAGAFMRYGGVSSFGDTYSAITNLSQSLQSGSLALLFGVVVAIMYLAAAIVLFYGSFLLISRALMMIFLMVTASIAFATYLIPTLSQGNFGWSAWWSTLLKNAVLAPLLMMFLWITLVIAKAFQVQQGSLGDLIKNPQSSLDISALLGYIIVIGLLFASFKVSSSFATSIGGFNFAESILSTPLAALNRYGIAPTLRNLPWVGGRGAAARAQTLSKDVEKEARAQARLPEQERNLSKLTNLMRQKDKAESRAKSTFDVANTRIGQAIGKGISVPAPLIAKTKTNFAESSKKKAEGAAKVAVEASVPKKDAEAAARKEVESAHEDRTTALKEQRAANAQLLKEAKTAADAAKDGEKVQEKLKTATNNARTIENEASKEKVDVEGKLERREIDKVARDRLIAEQDERIKTANATVQTIQGRINVIDKPVREREQALEQTEKDFAAHQRDIDKKIEARSQEILKAGLENAQDVGANLTQNWLQRTLNVPADTVTAKKAREMTKKKVGTKGLKERVAAEHEALKDAGEDGGETSSTSSEPKTGGTSSH